MKMRISLGFLLVSVLYVGAFEVLPAWGKDLDVTFANEVAGITPDMEVVAAEKGRLLQTGNRAYSSPEKESLTENKYVNAGFIVSDSAPVGTVIKLFEQKLGASESDEIFIDIGKREGVEKGDRFTVYSLDRYIYHPVLPGQGLDKVTQYTRRNGYTHENFLPHPGKPVGHRVLIRGVLEITEPGDKVSYARVVKTYESIEPGHLLTPYKEYSNPALAPAETDKTIEGYIVASKGDNIGIMSNAFIYIDKGWDDQVRPGDHFEVYSIPYIEEDAWYKWEPESKTPFSLGEIVKPKKTPLLPVVLGEIKVIATQKKTATAIVLKSRIDMKIGNLIRFKRSHHPG